MTNSYSKKVFSELVHLNLPLVGVEIHYSQEASKNIPWTKDKFSFEPYIYYKRKEGSVYLYYDKEGIEWRKEAAGNYNNPEKAIKIIIDKYNKIKDIIENEKVLNKKEFFEFIKKLKDIWLWLDYMWWAIEYRDSKNMNLNDLIKVRKYTEYFTPGFISVIRKSIQSIFPDKKKFADVLTIDEVLSGDLPNDSILEKRLNSYSYTNYKIYNSTEEILDEFNIVLNEGSLSEDLVGQPAYKGLVIGIVKIVKNRSDMKKVDKGDVLVASTTTPDFLPAMKRSGAIISEHGGAICHAAITSRELEIPCIVGVKGATKVLKDGDKVEVNADEGVVKIINRTNGE